MEMQTKKCWEVAVLSEIDDKLQWRTWTEDVVYPTTILRHVQKSYPDATAIQLNVRSREQN